MRLISAFFAFVFAVTMFAQTSIPRPEHPRPQFVRDNWVNLNGTWTYVFDFGESGLHRGLQRSKGFDNKITVPFCPESKLSGVEYKDFINSMWYHRAVEIPAAWDGKKVLLNFGGVDYFSAIYVNGSLAARHWGGSSSFSVDITRYVKAGETANVVVWVKDDLRSGEQTGGKQCTNYYSSGCHYTRTTGIWQTVWMEAVAPTGLQEVYVKPDLDNESFIMEPKFYALEKGLTMNIKVKDVDFDNNVVYVNVTKNRKPLIVPVNQTMANVLKEFLKYRKHKNTDDYLFCNAYGQQLVKSTCYHMLYEYNKRRGVERTGIHRYRHTFAKHWILSGGNVVSLSRLLGHSSLEITQNYINLLVSDVAKQVNEINLLDKFSGKYTIKMR